MNTELAIHHPDGNVQRFTLRDVPVLIGRDPLCDIVLDDLQASRRHARIALDPSGAHFIEDLGSRNGTLVNGQPVRRHPLAPGAHIQIGATRLIYGSAPAPPREPSTRVVVAEHTPPSEHTSFVPRTTRLRLSQQRLALLYELSQRLVSLRSPRELLEDVMNICFETLRFERGLIALRTRPGEDPEWPVVRNLRQDETGQLAISRSVLLRALEKGERTIINDVAAELADPTVSMAAHRIRSALCVPIEYHGEILGVIYGDRVSSTTVYEREDVDFLAALARQLSIGLTNARLAEEHRQRELLQRELLLARRIQTNLFPRDMPPRDDLVINAYNEPGLTVSGDYYDAITLPDGRLALLVADVSGKGVSAAILSANLQAAVRVTLSAGLPLPDAVARWNALICENTDEARFITTTVLAVDPPAREAEVVCAGHFPPILIAPDAVTPLAIDPALPLGVSAAQNYPARRFTLPDCACTLFLYSDGLPEAANERGELYGSERLMAMLRHNAHLPGEDLLRAIRDDVRRFTGRAPQSDDITMLAARLLAR